MERKGEKNESERKKLLFVLYRRTPPPSSHPIAPHLRWRGPVRKCDDLVVQVGEGGARRRAGDDGWRKSRGWATLVKCRLRHTPAFPPVGAQGAACKTQRRMRTSRLRSKTLERGVRVRTNRMRSRARCGQGLLVLAALRRRQATWRPTAVLIDWKRRIQLNGRSGRAEHGLRARQDGECDDVVRKRRIVKVVPRLAVLVVRGEGAGDG